MKERKQIILFDGVCNLCDGFVQFVIKRDPNAQFSFGTLQSSEAQRLLASIDLEPADLKTVIYLKDGKEMTRSTAALTILKDLGKWFGKKDACMIPSPELKARFLEA